MAAFGRIRYLAPVGAGPVERLPGYAEKRKATRSDVLSAATLACRSCDAPIAPGPSPLLLTDRIWCPICQDTGPVRDFVSLAAPTRPARVVVRVSWHGA
jgi:hypothetical protein